MAMRMLEAGGLEVLTDEIRQADPDNPRGYYEFEPVKTTKRDASWLPRAAGKAGKMVYSLLYDLPEGYQYRVLFLRRRMEEVLRSQEKMLERLGSPSEPVPDDAMERMFTAELEKCRRFLEEDPRFSGLEVDYNALLEGGAEVIDGIDRFLGGGLDKEAMAGVIDLALYRNRSGAEKLIPSGTPESASGAGARTD